MANNKEKKVQVDGLGDMVAKLIKKVTNIEPCDSCEKRKEWLNILFPTKKAIPMSEEELEIFRQIKDNQHLDRYQVDWIEELYWKTFNLKKVRMCRNCSKVWINVMRDLNKLYSEQTKDE